MVENRVEPSGNTWTATDASIIQKRILSLVVDVRTNYQVVDLYHFS